MLKSTLFALYDTIQHNRSFSAIIGMAFELGAGEMGYGKTGAELRRFVSGRH